MLYIFCGLKIVIIYDISRQSGASTTYNPTYTFKSKLVANTRLNILSKITSTNSELKITLVRVSGPYSVKHPRVPTMNYVFLGRGYYKKYFRTILQQVQLHC